MNNNKFFLYARKSSESDERQVQSLQDQIKIMKQKARSLWIKVIEVFQESMSAKAPWRYKFNEMILRVQNWEVKGIIAWKLDRLSRNPIDSGTIQFMLQNGQLETVISNDREYTETDAGLLMSVENGMSNQFIIDLKKNVRRWMTSKYQKWVCPTRAPLWYINNKVEKTIEEDTERFILVQRMWKMMLTGNYTPSKINTILADEYWLRTRKTKKCWRNKLTYSWIYKIFHNIFYTGYFYHKWELVQGTHKPMISLEEFDHIQILLWKKWNPKLNLMIFHLHE